MNINIILHSNLKKNDEAYEQMLQNNEMFTSKIVNISEFRGIDSDSSYAIIDIIVNVIHGVSTSLIAAYIYDLYKRIGKNNKRIIIENHKINATKEGIEALVQKIIIET